MNYKKLHINENITLFYYKKDVIGMYVCTNRNNERIYVDQTIYNKNGTIKKSFLNYIEKTYYYKDMIKELCFDIKNLMHNIKYVEN